MKKLTEIEKTILEELKYSGCTEDNVMYSGFAPLEHDMGLSKKELSKIFKSLRERDLVHYQRGLMNEDGELCGSGYCVTNEGLKLLPDPSNQ